MTCVSGAVRSLFEEMNYAALHERDTGLGDEDKLNLKYLRTLHKRLAGIPEETAGSTLGAYRSAKDVVILPEIQRKLGQAHVYRAMGVSPVDDRIYIRAMLNQVSRSVSGQCCAWCVHGRGCARVLGSAWVATCTCSCGVRGCRCASLHAGHCTCVSCVVAATQVNHVVAAGVRAVAACLCRKNPSPPGSLRRRQ
jgi:hypothetical protein